jgi:hypothetical protein
MTSAANHPPPSCSPTRDARQPPLAPATLDSQVFVSPRHAKPGAQSSVVPQLVLHSPFVPQRYGEHACAGPRTGFDERPSEVHVAPCGEQVPFTQDAPLTQSADVAHPVLHAPASSWTTHSAPPQVRVPCGAPSTGEQIPGLPGTSHASHGPVHALSQQTPS